MRKEFLKEFSRRVDSHEKNVAFIIVKVSRFKEINTTYGFRIADEYLEHVEETLKTILRNSDVVGRIGDNEFGVLLTGLNIRQLS